MSDVKWIDVLGWADDELEDLRFVGYSYIRQGKYDLAKRFFEALVVLKPDSEYDLQTLGALYLQTGKNLEALDYLERALKVNPSHSPTLLNRAKALFLLGYKRQGLTQAKDLESSEDSSISNQAKALVLSYS
jgi:tetratricopeptide (TPR) repeat protein